MPTDFLYAEGMTANEKRIDGIPVRSLDATSTRARRALNQESTAAPLAQLRPPLCPAEHTLAVSTPLSPAPRSYTAARDRIALPAGACRRSFLPNFREAVADCLAA